MQKQNQALIDKNELAEEYNDILQKYTVAMKRELNTTVENINM